MIQQQLSVFLKNEPGVLAMFCELLATEGINIQGIAITDSVDHAVIRVVVDQPVKALHLLGERGTLVVETDVLVVKLPNAPAALAGVAKRLAEADINIEYAYGSATTTDSDLYLRVSDVETAEKILGSG